MDRTIEKEIEPTIEEKIKTRKAIIPFLSDMFKEIKIEDNRQNVINVPVEGIKKALIDAISLIKFPEINKIKGEVEVTNQKEIQKVEIINQQEFPEINVEKTIVNFPELQKVAGEVTAINLPVGTDVEANSRTADPSKYLVVRLTDGQQFYSATGGAISAPMGRSTENIYLREEYTYATVSGIKVPTIVRKWTDTMVVTESYEYDGSADPVRKFRSIEPYNA